MDAPLVPGRKAALRPAAARRQEVDRGDDRINVYRRDGTFLYDIPVIPGTAALGTAGSAWDVDFSPDRKQTFMYESDGGNEVMWIFDHANRSIISGFGRPGHGPASSRSCT